MRAPTLLLLACLPLHAGMRGAFGKPFATCARVRIGQILLSIRCKDNHGAVAEEALRRAKFKFPGRQKIVASRNWGFTSFLRDDYVEYKREGRLINDGVNAKVGTCMLLSLRNCTAGVLR